MPFDNVPEQVHKLLKKRQWIQSEEILWDDDGDKEVGYCLLGAINHFKPSHNVKEDCIQYLGFEWEDHLTEWNDASKRKKSGVLRRIRLRINKAKQSLLLKV